MTTSQGWLAQCQDCSPTIGDYGEPVHVHQRFDEYLGAEMWASAHSVLYPHTVTVVRFISWDVNVDYLDPDVMNALFGNPI